MTFQEEQDKEFDLRWHPRRPIPEKDAKAMLAYIHSREALYKEHLLREVRKKVENMKGFYITKADKYGVEDKECVSKDSVLQSLSD